MKTFDEFVNMFTMSLKAEGFKKQGLNYRLTEDNNIALINIQKSMSSLSSYVKFTLNIGIHFKSLFFFSSGETVLKPIINDCQWRERIGNMMPIKKDYWWELHENSNVEEIATNFTEIFSTIIYPTIINNISDTSFANNLFTNNITVPYPRARHIYLSSLFCMNNDPRLYSSLTELKEYCDNNRLKDLYQLQLEKIEHRKNNIHKSIANIIVSILFHRPKTKIATPVLVSSTPLFCRAIGNGALQYNCICHFL